METVDGGRKSKENEEVDCDMQWRRKDWNNVEAQKRREKMRAE